MSGWARWLRFNIVGIAGFAVQLLTLAAVDRWFAVPDGIAVTLAVLAAVSHNFLWHERVTWPGQPDEGRWRRWLCFNLTTGMVSVVTNVIVTTLAATIVGAPLLVSNVIAVAVASLVNFRVSDRVVFNSNRAMPTGTTVALQSRFTLLGWRGAMSGRSRGNGSARAMRLRHEV